MGLTVPSSTEQQPQQQLIRPKRPRRRQSPASVAELTPEFAQRIITDLKTRPNKKSVNFGNQVAVRLIPTHHELTPTQFSATYYTPSDLEVAKSDGLSDVRMLRLGGVPENDSCGPCYRGIEHQASRQTKIDRVERRRAYVDAVLAEQYREAALNGYVANINDLATVAAAKSKDDKISALSRGRADESAMVGIVGRAVVDRARVLAQRNPAPTPNSQTHNKTQNQHKLASSVRKMRIGTVRRESYAPQDHAPSA